MNRGGRGCPVSTLCGASGPNSGLDRALISLHSQGPVGKGGCGAHWPKQMGPTDATTLFFGSAPVQQGTQTQRLTVSQVRNMGTERLGGGLTWGGGTVSVCPWDLPGKQILRGVRNWVPGPVKRERKPVYRR